MQAQQHTGATQNLRPKTTSPADLSSLEDGTDQIRSSATTEPLLTSPIAVSHPPPEEFERLVSSQIQDLQNVNYVMKTISFNGCYRGIVCQTLNGACPILSIANYLSLTSALTLPRHQRQISAASLTDLLGDYLINRQCDLSILARLEGLHRGLSVNPDFRGVNLFCDGQDIIQAFGAELVHGWIPAKDNPAHDLLTGDSRKNGVEDKSPGQTFTNFEAAQIQILTTTDTTEAVLMDDFLSRHPNNMTPIGLKELEEHMTDGDLSILFYNSHFSLLYKHPGSDRIFTLVTDAGYMEAGNHVVWESVTLDGDTQYFSAEFIPHTLINEVVGNDDYGKHKTHGLLTEDEALARTLEAEEHGHQHDVTTDRDVAKRLQDMEDRTASKQRQRELQRQREEDQRRLKEYNGTSGSSLAASRSTEVPRSSVLRNSPTNNPRRVAGEKSGDLSKKSKDCLIM